MVIWEYSNLYVKYYLCYLNTHLTWCQCKSIFFLKTFRYASFFLEFDNNKKKLSSTSKSECLYNEIFIGYFIISSRILNNPRSIWFRFTSQSTKSFLQRYNLLSIQNERYSVAALPKHNTHIFALFIYILIYYNSRIHVTHNPFCKSA